MRVVSVTDIIHVPGKAGRGAAIRFETTRERLVVSADAVSHQRSLPQALDVNSRGASSRTQR